MDMFLDWNPIKSNNEKCGSNEFGCSDASKMILSLSTFSVGFLLITIVAAERQSLRGSRSIHRITVALSEQVLFVILNQNKTPTGLNVLIIENFAKKIQLQIDYVIFNSSLNCIFAKEKIFDAFSIENNLRYFSQISTPFQF